jgi:prophage regulatory protein
MADPFLSVAEVALETGLSRATIYRRIEAGDFPRQQQLSPRRVAWRQSAIEAWKASRAPATPASQK